MSCLSRWSVAVLAAFVVACCPAFLNAQAPPADKPAEKTDKFAVPEGSNKDLAEFLMKLKKQRPTNKEEAERMREAVLKAAEKLLANNPNPQELALGAMAKASVLSDPAKVEQFAEELKTAGHENIARQVRGIGLILKLQTQQPTPATVKDRANEIIDFLAKGKIDSPIDIQLAQIAGQLSEHAGEAFAAEIYGKMQKIFAECGDKRFEPLAKMFEGTARRMGLVGNAMTIEGTIFGGEKFDLSKYDGKVVLVNFFATWCRPCQTEIANIKKCYELYHDKGFEVVALSCDRDPAALEKYLKEKKLPWPVVYGDKAPSPTVAYYGVNGIPQVMLIGRDGKVISLRVRGEALQKALEQLLGPAQEKPAKQS
jgi:thiol-disulfide isomerase/thioredoxin